MLVFRAFYRLARSAVFAAALGLGGLAQENLPAPKRPVPNDLAVAAPTADELAAIRREVAAYRQKIGDKAGLPEVEDKFTPIPKNVGSLTAAEAVPAFAKALPRLEKLRWWKIGLDPTKLEHPLREPAAVLAGCVRAARAGIDGGPRCLALAREAADFLLWAQAEGGTGAFPFPAVRGVTSSPPFAAVDRFLRLAERAGKLEDVTRNGWVVADMGDGGLQFDTGEAGLALLELYELTHEVKYLAAVGRAADWALIAPIARNWNYNAFSVSLLAETFRVTGEPRYLGAAVRKALLGVIPGQLTEGPRAGRWMDAHNARPAYHYIMMRGLAHLAAALPKDHPARPEVLRALTLGLLARNQEILTVGAANKDKAVEALLIVNRAFPHDAALLRATKSAEALDALALLVSDQYRRGGAPLGPREWGMFLEYLVWQAEQAEKKL